MHTRIAITLMNIKRITNEKYFRRSKKNLKPPEVPQSDHLKEEASDLLPQLL